MLAEPRFAALIPPAASLRLDEDESVALGVWPDLTLAYMNESYLAMARRLGGEGFLEAWGLGRSMVDALPRSLHGFYDTMFKKALEGNGLVTHSYLCPTPTEQRRFRAAYHCVGRNEGVLVVHRLLVMEPLATVSSRDGESYRDPDGMVRQCFNCRATKASRSNRWDFVSDFIERVEQSVSHGLCPPCEAQLMNTTLE